MATIDDKLTYLESTKSLIKQAIINKGQPVETTDTFRSLAVKIDNIIEGAKVFESVEQMQASTGLPNGTLAIVFNINFKGAYHYLNNVWVSIGTKVENLTSYEDLMQVMGGPEETYEGLGGTEQEVENILDDILEGPST